MNILELIKPLASSSDNALVALFLGLGAFAYLIAFAISVVVIVADWKLFTKAGEAGWKCLIPFYGAYIMYKIIYGNGWKFLLQLVPFLGTVVSIAASIRQAQVYGKDVGFGILNIFFAPITTCILAFGSATYMGPMDDKFI